jgi:6-pyruvoyltetrahydropterin/6-carboxytetrahydropterin synthase
MHGHNYIIDVIVEGSVDSKTGFVMDFHVLDETVKPLINTLDHQVLNDFIPNPTAESIAEWFLSRIPPASSCICWETPKCYAEVSR